VVESAFKRIERAYYQHSGAMTGCVHCGGLPRQPMGEGGWYDYSPTGKNGTLSNATWTQPQRGGLWVASFNGTNAKVDVGNTGATVKSAVLWIYPDDNTTRAIMDLDGGTHSIELDAAGDLTATGWAAPTVYVNGAASAAVAQDVWSCIGVTSATGFTANDLDIGAEATWFSGYISLVRLFSTVLTAVEMNSVFYANERHLYGV